ncbi:MAG: hypothetical protein WDO19_24170 [Bacteroidota bacterium]
MKLNKLKLPHSVISGLYSKSLVTTGDDRVNETGPDIRINVIETDEPLIAAPQIQFLGGNKKNILILVNYEKLNYLPDEELTFLTSMLGACKLNLADVAIINLDKIPAPSYKEILDQLNGNILLLFGTDPSRLNLPVSFPHFQVQSFNKYTFLYTPSLDEMKNDKILKSKLWVCLRRIFNV